MKSPRVGRRAVLIAVLLALCAAAMAALIASGRAEARRLPLMREARIEFPDLPPTTAPIRLALLSDIHIGNAATSPARLSQVVEAVNAAKPDAIVIVGDFVNGSREDDPAARPNLLEKPLSRLSAPLGIFATLGNHDHWTDAEAVRSALERAGITVLANTAARVGPFALAGIDDATSGHANSGLTLEKASRLGGVPIVVTHSPTIEGWLPRPLPLMLHGHTHCGQAVLHVGSMRLYPAELLFGRPYAESMRCGLGRSRGLLSVATAGIGTTSAALRYGAPPDWWLLTLAPVKRGALIAPRQDQQNASAGER